MAALTSELASDLQVGSHAAEWVKDGAGDVTGDGTVASDAVVIEKALTKDTETQHQDTSFDWRKQLKEAIDAEDQDTSAGSSKLLKKDTTKAKSKQKSGPFICANCQQERIQYNPLVDPGCNVIIPEAKAQRERWQNVMNDIHEQTEVGVFVPDKSGAWKQQISQSLGNQPNGKRPSTIPLTIEWDMENNVYLLSNMMETIHPNISAFEITSAIERAARTIFTPDLKANNKKHLTDCQDTEKSVSEMLATASNLQLMKQLYGNRAEIFATKCQLHWLEMVEKKWLNDDKLHKVINTLRTSTEYIYITSRQLIHHISCYIARYFQGRKVELALGMSRIRTNLAMVKAYIESMNVGRIPERIFKYQAAIEVMKFDYLVFQTTYSFDLEFNTASIMPPMELDMK